jgi:hypothetical protein
MTSTEQSGISVEDNNRSTTLHRQSSMLSISDSNFRGIEQIANLRLHESSSGGASNPDSCSVSGPSPRAGSDGNGALHAASTAEQLTYCDKAYWDNRYARELAHESAAPPHFDW